MFIRFLLVLITGLISMTACSQGRGDSLRILSYNIHHANPPAKPGLIDLPAIAEVIRQSQADIVALQEVDVYTHRSGEKIHEAATLAQLTGMYYYFARAIDYDGGQYGIAILSRWPMTDTQHHPLPTIASTNGEPRILATAVLQLPSGRKIRFACTHLDAQRSDSNRLLQIREINRCLKKGAIPCCWPAT